MSSHAFRGLSIAVLFLAVGAAAEETQKIIRELYTSSFAAMREARTKEDIIRLVDGFDAPEWVGNMPAGETLTRADTIRDGEAALAIPPEKRIPQMDIVYLRETGWNVLVVYWRYRKSGRQLIGALYRDTWVRTAPGWRRIRQEKFFPDRPLVEDGKPVFLPGGE
jgi:hypothetical protein